MSIREDLLKDLDPDYLSFLNSKPNNSIYRLADINPYATKRKNYYDRLENEKNDFNNAIDTTLNNYNTAVLNEKKKKALKKKESANTFVIALLFLLMIVVNMIVTVVFIPSGSIQWFQQNINLTWGFEHFFSPPPGQEEMAMPVCSAIALIISLIIAFGVFGESTGGAKAGIVIGVTLVGCVVIRFVIALLSFIGSVIVSQFSVIIVGGAFIIFMIFKGRNLETGFYIFRFIFNIVCTVIVSIIFYLISDKIVNGMSIEDAFNSVLPFLNL